MNRVAGLVHQTQLVLHALEIVRRRGQPVGRRHVTASQCIHPLSVELGDAELDVVPVHLSLDIGDRLEIQMPPSVRLIAPEEIRAVDPCVSHRVGVRSVRQRTQAHVALFFVPVAVLPGLCVEIGIVRAVADASGRRGILAQVRGILAQVRGILDAGDLVALPEELHRILRFEELVGFGQKFGVVQVLRCVDQAGVFEVRSDLHDVRRPLSGTADEAHVIHVIDATGGTPHGDRHADDADGAARRR